MGPGGLLKSPKHVEGIVLSQVYPTAESETTTNIDVIALHGLDTNSSETWTWKQRGKPEKQDVNWLKDPCMLPKRIPTARIFTCDWPASIFQERHTIQMTMKELARRLLLSIRSRLGARPTRPILFIASCLGGIVLTQAMTIASDNGSEYESLWRQTRGIVFLATPFAGTSFKDIAQLAVRFLEIKAYFTGTVVTNLLASLQSSDQFLQELVAKFTNICVQPAKAQGCQLAIFYETKMSNPYRNAMPEVIADLLNKPKLLVDSSSARLHIVKDPIALDRTHVMMNKFAGPEDNAFNDVSGQIKFMIDQIIEAQPIEKARNWIYYRRYLKKLNIERLSDDLLPMNRCYINLGIVMQPSNQRNPKDGMQKSSPFSLSSRLKIETTHESKEITLSTLFEARKTSTGQLRPNRIMIWGRAGVGKTTLCKKIVYEFIHNDLWRDLYNIVLWVPLRNLKEKERCKIPGYNLNHLLRHEFFSQSMECDELADSLWHAIGAGSCKALFILDGLDEVSSHVSGNMLDFLNTLLNQSNVIVTSRPNATVSKSLDSFDLCLETVGFYPDQVKDYIENVFTNLETGQSDLGKIDAVQSFLDRHHLVQTLVRIPIQLDAFCYIWNNSHDTVTRGGNMPETMTAIYQQIVKSLWRKDAKRLEKWDEATFSIVMDGNIEEATRDEVRLLQYLAFNGMYSDVIEFGPEHRDMVIKSQPQNGMLLDDILGRVSFLRSSDPSLDRRDRSYHFLHLTFQEFFAAQYFVRQWKDRNSLDCLLLSNAKNEKFSPTGFLQRFKYNTRYDIFWRFVAGLLDDSIHEIGRLFQAIQEEPRDLLGLAHQRLIMHCLSEVSEGSRLRPNLEDQLVRWITFEYQLKKLSSLIGEVELRAEVLEKVLQEIPERTTQVLQSLAQRHGLSEKVVRVIATYLGHKDEAVRSAALRGLENQTVPEEHFPTIIAHLEDKDENVRYFALMTLQKQPEAGKRLTVIIERLKDKSSMVRFAARLALQDRPIAEEHLLNIIACLKDECEDTRKSTLMVLGRQPVADEYLSDITACLEDEELGVRRAAIEALSGQVLAEKHLPAIIACLERERDWTVRDIALSIIRKQSAAEKYRLAVIACLEDKNSRKLDQTMALELLIDEPPLAQAHIQAIVTFLRDEDFCIRSEALAVFGRRLSLPIEILRALATLFESKKEDIRLAAVEAMRLRPNLPIEILRAFMPLFKDENEYIREGAVGAMRLQPNLPIEILRALATLFESKKEDIKLAAVGALRLQPSLPIEILRAVMPLFKDENEYIREGAVGTMRLQPNLPIEILRAVMPLFKDENKYIREEAVMVFRGQNNLLVEFFREIAALLKDGEEDVIRAAVDTFVTHGALSLIPDRHIKSFYKVLLDDSFEEHIVWQVVAGTSYIMVGNQEYSAKWSGRSISAVRRVQKEYGIPSLSNSTDSRVSRLMESLRWRGTKKPRRCYSRNTNARHPRRLTTWKRLQQMLRSNSTSQSTSVSPNQDSSSMYSTSS
ncbi:ARM repeat-containing protein [Xylaria scruposa]|nr:ARM repeat-containing protein [Xylaria scruposa]